MIGVRIPRPSRPTPTGVPARRAFALTAPLLMAALALALACAACGDDKNPGPPGPREARLTQVLTAGELVTALTTAVAGDTIQVLPGLGGGVFNIGHSIMLKPGQAPLLLIGDERSPVRPRLVFPDTAEGLVIQGHLRAGSRETTIENIDFQGGRNSILLEGSRVTVRGCTFRQSLYDGINATGAASDGTVELCYFEGNGAFAISTHGGSRLVARRNTVVHAGDCGFYIDSNAVLTANNVVQCFNVGIILQSGATNPTVQCNNAYQNSGGNYAGGSYDFMANKNYELNPQFCAPGVYTLKSGSPLTTLNSGGCGTIGAFEIGCE